MNYYISFKLFLSIAMRNIGMLCFILLFYEGCASDSRPAPESWPVPVISPGRWDHQAIKLLDGRILITGGMEGGLRTSPNLCPDVSLIIDPVTGDVQSTGFVSRKRIHNTATLLRDGRVLIAGGQGVDPFVIALDHAEIFDPATNQFQVTAATMLFARYNHTATLLANGMVHLTGGDGLYVDSVLAECELFDPGTGTFLSAPRLIICRTGHMATLLDSGSVLIAGGVTWIGPNRLYPDEAELLDPVTFAFHLANNKFPLPFSYEDNAVKLPSGKVLLLGLRSNVAVLFNPVTEEFEGTGAPIHSRDGATCTLLEETGEVLIAGGYTPNSAFTPVMQMEIYNPETGQFVEYGTLQQPRFFHTATLLPENKVLLVGGIGSDEKPIEQCEMVQVR